MNEEENNISDLKKYIDQLANSGEKELDQEKMKKLKKICKSDDIYITEAHKFLLKHLKRKHSEVRFSCVQMIEELFKRSHNFRLLIVEVLDEILEMILETDPDKPLPPPKKAAKQLKEKALLLMKDWVEKYGDGYKKLKIAYNFLKQVKRVDFNDMTFRSEAERLREEQKQERLDNIWRERVKRVKTEMEEEKTDIEDCLRQTNNSLELLIPTPSDFCLPETEEEKEKINITNEKIADSDGVSKTCDIEYNRNCDEDDDYSSVPAAVREHGLLGIAVSDIKVDIGNVGTKTNEFDEAVVEVVLDQYRRINRRMLPMAKKWVTILTRAGNVTDQDLLRKSIDVRNLLEDAFKRINGLGLDVRNRKKTDEDDDSSTDDEDFVEVEDKSGYEHSVDNELGIPFMPVASTSSGKKGESSKSNHRVKEEEEDPTTLAATLKVLAKRTNNSSTVASNTSEDTDASDVVVKDTSSDNSSDRMIAPVVRIEDEIAPTKIVIDSERSRFWASSSREGETITLPQDGVGRRVVEFVGKFEPVQWSCRAPLPSGRLCPRQDRFKCPLHGAVIARDNMGRPNGEGKVEERNVEEVQPWRDEELQRDIEAVTGQSLVFKKGKKRKSGLTDVGKEEDTVRKRLEKKVFNRSSMKRVAAALDISDARKVKEKFSEQFNYVYEK